MSKPAIVAENLGKAYRIGLKEEMPDSLMGAATSWMKSPLSNFHRLRRLNTFNSRDDAQESDLLWALRDISFKIEHGEVVGIIGRNGAGKSTLLKILSRITEPTHGRAVIRGRVSSLLEVGTGFHPELTGRENIYMNGTILGMRKKEIDRKFDQIVEFSGVEKFLDTPTKRYSSGMQVRLAFAVAAHLEPEILIVDEVLAVGDGEFQKKCIGKMHDVARGGRTVLFVSHNMAAVESLCTRALMMDAGTLRFSGKVQDTLAEYLRGYKTVEPDVDLIEFSRASHHFPIIRKIRLLDDEGRPTTSIPSCSSLVVEIAYQHDEPIENPLFGVHIESMTGVAVTAAESIHQSESVHSIPREGTVRCTIASLPLVPGTYYLSFRCASSRTNLDFLARAVKLEVCHADVYGTGRLPSARKAMFLVDGCWELPSVPSMV